MKLRFISSLAAICLLASCDLGTNKFDIVRAGNQTYLVNKQTGESKLIEGTTLIDVRAPDNASIETARSKIWPSQKLPNVGEISLSIKTKYRDGRMVYVITASPYDGALAKNALQSLVAAQINFTLYDSDSFEIGQVVELPVREGSRIVDDKGKATAMQWAGSREMSSASYREAVGIVFGWKGFITEAKSE